MAHQIVDHWTCDRCHNVHEQARPDEREYGVIPYQWLAVNNEHLCHECAVNFRTFMKREGKDLYENEGRY